MWASLWFSVAFVFLRVYSAQFTLFPEECGGHRCLNGGECYFSFDEKLGDQFICRCQEPYYGKYCEDVRNPTEPEPNITTAGLTLTRNEYNLTTEITWTTDQATTTDNVVVNTTGTLNATVGTTLLTDIDEVGNSTKSELNITTNDWTPTENKYNLTTEYYFTTDQENDKNSSVNITDTFFTTMSTTVMTLKDPCSDKPCQNGGICQVEGWTYKCFCPAPFTGRTCSTDPCSDSPCKNGGICAVEADSHACYCPQPFTGRNCEIDPCSEKPCENGGICKIEGNTFRCTCKPSYFGLRCEKDICNNNPCQNGGICKADRHGYKCYCALPFTGTYCEKGPCSGNPCNYSGICKVEGNSHVCYCRSPYSGKSCEIDPCTAKPCMNNGTCKVYKDSFACHCKKPYYGDICQKDPCTVNPCQNNGTCAVNGRSFNCTCKEPFIGRLCNEIMTPSTIPTTESESIITLQPDKCQCPNGFCVTSENGVECACNPGFAKNPNGYCEACFCGGQLNGETQFNCTFEKQWFVTQKTCICPKGYEEVNEQCVDACYFSPCKNGGTCRLTNDSYVCDCPEAFTGKRCQIEKCSSINCKNGKCITRENGKTECVCNAGYAKHPDGHCKACNCGKKFDCTFEKTWFVISKNCICPKSYIEENGKCRDPCSFEPCFNGGTCKFTDDSYFCECPKEFTGNRCQKRTCNCENGKCIKSGKEYKCVCNSDYGMYSAGVCKACNCGKNFTCTFDKGLFWDKTYCVCPEGFSMVNKECNKNKPQ